MMTPEQSFKILSNDYQDLLIEWGGNQSILNMYQQYSPHILSSRYAVIYVPTSQININSVEEFGFMAFPFLYGLQSAQSLEASGIHRVRRFPAFNLRGNGVMVGIIDTGIDYTHPCFRHPDGTTKILSIWDQTIDTPEGYPAGTFYGTYYTADQINEALNSDNPLDVVPSTDEIGHGTALAGIAAGSEISESNFSGVVPDSDIAVVKLKQAKQNARDFFLVPPEVPCYMEHDIMWALRFLISEARRVNRPMSLCFGLGTNQGGHDGRGPLNTIFSIGANFPGVVINIAAGNESTGKRHFSSTADPMAEPVTVELNVGENEQGFSMELWGRGPATYSVDITSPSGENIPRIGENLTVNRMVRFIFEETEISVNYRMVEATSGDQLILMRFRSPTPGIWRFRVYARGDLPGTFNIWLPVGQFIGPDTYFIQSSPYTTVTSPGNSYNPITFTAYNPENSALYQPSGKGFTSIGLIKPDLAAPGVNIQAPNLQNGFNIITGTGAAAAHGTGISAMILEWGSVRGFYPGIDSKEVKKLLITGARRSGNLRYPNRDWGYGVVDIFNVFNQLRSDL